MLERNVDAERDTGVHMSVGETIRNPRVLLLAALYFSFVIGLYGIAFWLPQLIRSMGVQAPLRVGLLSAIPYGVAAITMVLYGQNSDRMKERRWHLVVGALFGAFGLAMAGRITGNETVGMLALTFATMGSLAVVPMFWTLPTAFLRGASAAAGYIPPLSIALPFLVCREISG